jgi:Predicted xylanase/chitin deacetylase
MIKLVKKIIPYTIFLIILTGCSLHSNNNKVSTSTNSESSKPSDIKTDNMNYNPKSIITNNNTTDNNTKPTNPTPSSAQDSAFSLPEDNKPTKVLEPTYHDILGKSNKYGPKDLDNWKKWKDQILDLAKANKNDVFINGFTDKKEVSLTFDDGPDGTVTPKILDILKANKVNASFFFIGENVKNFPQVVKRTYNEGNLVLNHSYTHPELSKKNNAEIDKELCQTENSIFSLIGKRPAIIRPPYGDLSQAAVDEIKKNNYKMIIWSIDTFDWSQKEKANIINNVISNVRPGDIILMHSNGDKKTTAEALPEIIKQLKENGYDMVTVDKLLKIPAYKD